MPPSPVCVQPTERAERVLLADLPLRRLDELEHPDRPALVPAAQRQPEGGGRLALHLPVCTSSSGRLRRWRVVSPSSGTAVGCPCGTAPSCARRGPSVHQPGERSAAARRGRRRGAPAAAREPRRRARAAPAPTRSRRRPWRSRPPPGSPAARRRPGPGRRRRGRRPVARPSVTHHEQRRGGGVAQPLDGAAPRARAAGPRPAGCARRCAARQPGLRGGDRTVGGSATSAPVAAEGDQADLVPALVGVAQQRQHGALDRAHPRAGPPSSRRRRRRRARGCPRGPRASALAQVVAAHHEPGAGRPRGPWCGAAARTVAGRCSSAARRGVPASGATIRPLSVRARERRPGAPSPMPGTSSRRARNGVDGGGRGARRAVAGRPRVARGPPGRRRRPRLTDPTPRSLRRAPSASSGRAPARRRPGRRDPGRRAPGRRDPGSSGSGRRGPRRPGPRRASPRPGPARRTGRGGAGAAAPAGRRPARPPSPRVAPRQAACAVAVRAMTRSARMPSTSNAAQTAAIRRSSASGSTTEASRARASAIRRAVAASSRRTRGERRRVGVVGEPPAHDLDAGVDVAGAAPRR